MRRTGGRKGKNRVGNPNRKVDHAFCLRKGIGERRERRSFRERKGNDGECKGYGMRRGSGRSPLSVRVSFFSVCKPAGLVDIVPPLIFSSNYLDRMARCIDPPFIGSDLAVGDHLDQDEISRRRDETTGERRRKESDERRDGRAEERKKVRRTYG